MSFSKISTLQETQRRQYRSTDSEICQIQSNFVGCVHGETDSEAGIKDLSKVLPIKRRSLYAYKAIQVLSPKCDKNIDSLQASKSHEVN